MANTASIFAHLLDSCRKHNFYYRILAPFTIFSIVIVCLSAGASWCLLGNRYDRKLRESNRKTLEQVQQYTDQSLYSNTMALLNDSFLGGYCSPKLEDFFSYGSRLSESALLDDYQQLIKLCIQNPFIEHITMYQKDDDILLDTVLGLRYNACASAASVNKILPFTTYLDKTGNSPEKILYLTDSDLKGSARDGLTMVRSVPFYLGHSEAKGFISIHFNEKKFLSAMNNKFSLEGGFFLLSPDRVPLLQLKDDVPDYETLLTITGWTDAGGHEYFHDFSWQGARYCLTWVKSSDSKWTCLSYIPINVLKAETNAARQFALMTVLLFVLFSMIAVQRISSKIYRPITALRAKFETERLIADSRDDLSAIEDAFNFLEGQVDDMRNTLDLNSHVLCYKSLIELLYNKDFSHSAIQKRLELCKIHFTETNFCLAVVDFETTVFYTLDIGQREYLTGKTKELVSHWFREDTAKIAESHPDSQVITLLNLSVHQYKDFCGNAKQLNVFLQKNLHIKVNLAVSSLAGSLEEISRIYSETLKSLQYFFICNYGNTFTPDQVAEMENAKFSLSEKDCNYLEELMRSDHISELAALLSGYVNTIHNEKCSYDSSNCFLMQIYGIAFRLCKESGLFDDTLKKNQVIEDFNQAATLDSSMECIYLLLQLYHEALNEESRNADAKLIGQVTDYMKKHCLEDLTLPAVADAFRLSPSHLSRMFKSVMGENFSVFLIDQKLLMAAEMLLKHPEQNIAGIARAFGYYTPAYFTRLFKEKYGVTPSQYRKGVL